MSTMKNPLPNPNRVARGEDESLLDEPCFFRQETGAQKERLDEEFHRACKENCWRGLEGDLRR